MGGYLLKSCLTHRKVIIKYGFYLTCRRHQKNSMKYSIKELTDDDEGTFLTGS